MKTLKSIPPMMRSWRRKSSRPSGFSRDGHEAYLQPYCVRLPRAIHVDFHDYGKSFRVFVECVVSEEGSHKGMWNQKTNKKYVADQSMLQLSNYFECSTSSTLEAEYKGVVKFLDNAVNRTTQKDPTGFSDLKTCQAARLYALMQDVSAILISPQQQLILHPRYRLGRRVMEIYK